MLIPDPQNPLETLDVVEVVCQDCGDGFYTQSDSVLAENGLCPACINGRILKVNNFLRDIIALPDAAKRDDILKAFNMNLKFYMENRKGEFEFTEADIKAEIEALEKEVNRCEQ